jgi:hypothetical protein
MSGEGLPVAPPIDTQLALAGAHQFVLTRGAACDELKICCLGVDQPLLSISVNASGVAVRVSAASVTIEATDLLRLEAKRLVLSALRELVIESAGDVRLHAAGDLSIKAAEQLLSATQGDVRLLANDDVRLDGERVLMNCE